LVGGFSPSTFLALVFIGIISGFFCYVLLSSSVAEKPADKFAGKVWFFSRPGILFLSG